MTTHNNEHELGIEIEVQAEEVGRLDIGTQIKIYTRNMATQYEDITVRSFGIQTGLFTAEAQTQTEITSKSVECQTLNKVGGTVFSYSSAWNFLQKGNNMSVYVHRMYLSGN